MNLLRIGNKTINADQIAAIEHGRDKLVLYMAAAGVMADAAVKRAGPYTVVVEGEALERFSAWLAKQDVLEIG